MNINSNTGSYWDKFDYFGADIYAEFEFDGPDIYTTLIEIGGVELMEHLKESYVKEIEQEIMDRMNKI